MTSGGNSSPARIRQLRRGALLASAFGLVPAYVLFQLTRGEVSWAELAKVDPKMLALALSLVVFTWVVDGLRMKVLVQALGGRLSLGRGQGGNPRHLRVQRDPVRLRRRAVPGLPALVA